MLAVLAMLRASPDLQEIRPRRVAVAAARTATPTVMDPQFDLAERTVALDHHSNCALRFILERRGHS